jgi:GT2 family glycosyltransferase
VYLGVFRRSVFDELGGFDESLLRNQDYELNYRIRRAGGVVYFHPDLRVRYLPRRSLGALWKQYFDYGRWKRAVLKRHIGSLRWRQMVPPAFVLGLLASAVLAFTPWWWASLIVPGSYLLAVGGATVRQRVGSSDNAALMLPLVYPTMHLGWGLGFLVGRTPAG